MSKMGTTRAFATAIFGVAIVAGSVSLAKSTSAAAPAAQRAAKSAAAQQQVKGYLIDVACATGNVAKPKSDFGTKHTRACLRMADCARSGYGVLTPDNKLVKFDAAGNNIAKSIIGNNLRDHDWRVVATGTVTGDTMSLADLELQR